MGLKSKFTALLLSLAVFFSQLEPAAWAQSYPLTSQQLDQLLSPVALYPDSLLSQIITASSNPQEILDVDNWLYANPNLQGTALTDAAQQQGFDPAFIALVNFPQVLDMMAQNVDDYAAIGQAFLSDQGAVSDSIQRLRAQAYASGALRSNEQQTIVVQQAPQPVYVIQPANPQVVYVPQYNPTVVYAAPSTGTVVAASLITFGIGIGIGALMVSNQPWGWGGWGWNWGSRRVYYNHGYWGGWGRPYRPPNPWYRPRPIVWTSRPGYGGNWHYRPPNYRPPRPENRPPGRPPWSPSRPPGYRPPSHRPPTSRPPTSKPPTSRPPGNRPPGNPNGPGSRPPTTNPKPNPNPGQPGRPNTRPSQPPRSPGGNAPPNQAEPAPSRPTPKPAPQPRPATPSRPAPKPASPPPPGSAEISDSSGPFTT